MAAVMMPPSVLNQMMKTIAEVSHMMTDLSGEPVRFGTLDAKNLKTAAIMALTVAVGEPVWPGDEILVIPNVEKRVGVFRFER